VKGRTSDDAVEASPQRDEDRRAGSAEKAPEAKPQPAANGDSDSDDIFSDAGDYDIGAVVREAAASSAAHPPNASTGGPSLPQAPKSLPLAASRGASTALHALEDDDVQIGVSRAASSSSTAQNPNGVAFGSAAGISYDGDIDMGGGFGYDSDGEMDTGPKMVASDPANSKRMAAREAR